MNRPVRWISLVCAAGVVWLLIGIVQAWIRQPLSEGGAAIIAVPWGQVTLIDLYAGFFFSAVWIVSTERPWGRVAFWLLGLAVLGNIATLGLFALRGWHARSVADVLVPRPDPSAN
jgi:hypothetical protein